VLPWSSSGLSTRNSGYYVLRSTISGMSPGDTLRQALDRPSMGSTQPTKGESARWLSPVSVALKRVLDIVGAVIGLVVLSPLFLYLAWRIKRESPGPAIFRQRRLGRDMHEFTMLKFRTMRVEASEDAHREYIKEQMNGAASPNGSGLYKLERKDVVTPFGEWLRRSSLDELPQLVNVLRGDMSLVGPRPCMSYEIESFAPHHFERFLVPAGMTGLWQVTTRAESTFGEALELDVEYARTRSLVSDLSLLLRTPAKVFRGSTA
jgi:lipopolysaccharide/colanic/teichoic acid biosynthesis glycosyltransferase